MIFIIGSADEFHSRYIYEYIKNKGEEVKYLDTRTIPANFICSWYTDKIPLDGFILIDSCKIDFDMIKSVYWRWSYGVNIQPNSNSDDDIYSANIRVREFSSFIESLYDVIECKWVNSQKAINMHKNKPYQLNLMAKNGIRVPKTLITTDKDELLNFVDNLKKELIYKPVRGGAHTKELKAEDLTPQKLEFLKYSPVTFQEKLNGVDVRIYGIGNELFAAELRTDAIDFREDSNAQIIVHELPESVKKDCLKIMQLFDLKFTGIDVRYNPETNEYVFIEANPSPMFVHFEKKTGYPITEKLFELLAS